MSSYLEIADGEVGYRGDGNNHTKYWLDLNPGLNGQPWCACFVSWCLWKAGVLSAIGGSAMYSCTQMMNKAKAQGQWASNPVVGSLAIYDFGSGSPAHVEFVVGTGSSLTCIGGNTSGDYVARKTRSKSDIMGYWHIEAAHDTYVPGTGNSGPVDVGYGTLVTAATMTITGADELVTARFATPRRAGFTS